MKKKLHYLIISFIILFFSCDNEPHESAFKDSNSEVTVLLERDNNYPLKLVSDSYIERSKRMTTRSVQPDPPSSSFTNYLGQGYNVTAIPIADASYISSPVIDMSKLLKNPNDSSAYYKKLRYSRAYPDFFAFSKYYRYSMNNQVSDKIETGGSVNLDLFNIGAKKTTQTVFKNNFTEIDSTAYAELHLNIYKHIYQINIATEYDKQKFAFNYLHPIFIEDLYNSTPKEILNKYGHFLLKGFYTGGTCTALFGGKFHGTYSEQSREIILSDSVYAGFKIEENAANGNLYIKLGRSESSSSSDNTSTIFLSMKTVGGNSGYPTAFGIPVKFSNVDINLSAWGNSLDISEDNHELIDLVEKGLIPLEDFILEKDIKTDFKYLDHAPNQYQEPYFIITKVQNIRNNYKPSYTVDLVNRLGYKIHMYFSKGKRTLSDVDDATVVNYIRNHFKAPRIEMKVVSRLGGGGRPSDRRLYEYFSFVLDKTQMRKFVNPQTGIIYLLFDDGSNKHALSIGDEFLLDTYGIREFVSSLPEINLSLQQLIQYRICSL